MTLSSSAREPDAALVSKWVAPDVGDGSVGQQPVSEASIASIRKSARDEGYAEGLKRGLAEGRATVQLFDNLTECLAEPLGRLEPEALECMVQLSLQVAQAIISRELTIDDALVLNAVASALDALPDRRAEVRIGVNPADHKKVLAAYSELNSEPNLHVVADASVEQGGAIVESGSTLVDAQTETRLRSLLETLLVTGDVPGDALVDTNDV